MYVLLNIPDNYTEGVFETLQEVRDFMTLNKMAPKLYAPGPLLLYDTILDREVSRKDLWI